MVAIWAPAEFSSIGRSLFLSTGNTFGAASWGDGEAVFRLSTDLHRSADKRDYFAPPDWRALDQRDADLGGANPLPLDIQSKNGTQALILALGKDGRAYVLDRNDLGGIGGSLLAETVSSAPIRTAPATYQVAGDAFVAFQGPGSSSSAACAQQRTRRFEDQSGVPASHDDGLVWRSSRRRLANRYDHRWAFGSDCVDCGRRRR